jgi:ribosomal protein S12 methylthiotransferase accessory factor YcaO
MNEHHPLPSPTQAGLPLPCKPAGLGEQEASQPGIETLRERIIANPLPETPPRPMPGETARIGLERLERFGVVQGPLQRHEASLSPVALLRQWRLEIEVKNGRHDYTLSGTQTAYGRGLALEDAMASYVMEMVERKSSFASLAKGKTNGYRREHDIAHGNFSTLRKGAEQVLDPNTLALDIPYQDEPLYWIRAERNGPEGRESVLVPAQCVFLFCNLDEIQLFSGLGSTGLASGNSLEEAKVSALLEIIERDHESVTPFDPRQCFTMETRDPSLAELLLRYRQQGIHLQFQDLTSSMEIPCCKCFVMDRTNRIVKGCGASLNAAKALLSAMTETPFPFPAGPASAPGLEGLLRVPMDALPDYSTGNPAGDLALLEAVLAAHGFHPLYVDLTRKDIDLPVVRAIVPGMEVGADVDWYSRVRPRLFRNYTRMM